MDGYRELLDLLGDEPTSAGRYMLLRSKLVAYFEGRRISPSEDFADEVLHRVAAKISAGEKIQDINRYVFGVARFVRLESYRTSPEISLTDNTSSEKDEGISGSRHLGVVPPTIGSEENEESEDVLRQCMTECLEKLSDDHRHLILRYYETDETTGKHKEYRKRLARESNKSAGALQKQICLLRQKIGNCAKECAEGKLNS
jgi:DNA-directed RNA polymerase specialized sigma24 family protein